MSSNILVYCALGISSFVPLRVYCLPLKSVQLNSETADLLADKLQPFSCFSSLITMGLDLLGVSPDTQYVQCGTLLHQSEVLHLHV